MIASIHVADVGTRAALRSLRRTPDPAATAGLRYAVTVLAAKLNGAVLSPPDRGRAGLLAFWDDDEALGRFLAVHPLADGLGGGWHARLEPVRASGSWPGGPDMVPGERAGDHDGPAVVVTLGRLRASQAVRFLRASARAAAPLAASPGLVWATGLGRPPVVATCSLWQSARALEEYAYGHRGAGAHRRVIEADRARPFHHDEVFIRFRPYHSSGHLDGRNPLRADWMRPAGQRLPTTTSPPPARLPGG